MQIYDVTIPITEKIPVWPGDPSPIINRFSRMEEGADCNVSQIAMCVHLGTHIDAPYHYLGVDSDTVDKIPLHLLTGRAYVIHLSDHVSLINSEVLKAAAIPTHTRRVLFKTRNSSYWTNSEGFFQKEFAAISSDGAEYLIRRGIKLVGIDYLSIAPFHEQKDTHRILLKAGVIIVEGLDLSHVGAGRYSLYCLPLKIVGTDGAPARVILIGV